MSPRNPARDYPVEVTPSGLARPARKAPAGAVKAGETAPDGTVYARCPYCAEVRKASPLRGKRVAPSIAVRLFTRLATHISTDHVRERG